MVLLKLKNRIEEKYSDNKERYEEILSELESYDQSIYPFNDDEYFISSLIFDNLLTREEYLQWRSEYIAQNPYLSLYEISAPRLFGERFAQNYVMGMSCEIKKPSKVLDPNYVGQYDLWLDGIRIEVKASRAVSSEIDGPLYKKALPRNTQYPFNMNFQQLKPKCCDVFVWVAVFIDEIVVWVMSNSTVENNKYYSTGQHRGNSGNEGQLHINQDNIIDFDQYALKDNNIVDAIKSAK
ncbi:MAG: hypothetical protein R3Y16_07335 [Rikenellaceae bacterium]